jgi:hypothetical protein
LRFGKAITLCLISPTGPRQWPKARECLKQADEWIARNRIAWTGRAESGALRKEAEAVIPAAERPADENGKTPVPAPK